VPNVTIRLSTGDSVTTDASGQFVVTAPAGVAVTLEPAKTDDVRGSISSLDSALALEHKVHIITLDPLQQLACDVTGNGEITSLDAARILQLRVQAIARAPVALACGSDWVFVPVPDPVPNQTLVTPLPSADPCRPGAITYAPLNANATGQNFTAVLFGDCTGNWAQSQN
jgi:hypothetical protein